ncbi:MAG: hypothetical protein M1339_01900 [Bacteroidetes bacterium]|nr:hypothetical protein [Bacteroidota bacterium]
MAKKMLHFSAVLLLLLSTNSFAQVAPPLNSLMSKVEAVSLPSQSYTVPVSQNIAYTGTVKSSSSSLRAVSGISTFQYTYNPKIGLRVATASTNKSVNSVQPPTNAKQPTLKVAVDLAKLLRGYTSWQNVRIVPVSLNGESCYEITAQDNSFSYMIWVDTTDYFVSQVILNIKGKRFAQIDITNRNVSGSYWLPSQIVLSNALDGSVITLNMGQYIF